MKTSLRNLIVLATLFGTAGAMADTPFEKEVPVDHVYSPIGFDSNDSTEVVVEGFLPNLCHKSPKTKVEINGDTINIKLTSLYYDSTTYFCPEMIVPFTETVSLGLLDKGNYKIVVNGKTPYEATSKLKIAEATSDAIDEFTYAYVDYVEKAAPASKTVKLKGYNPSDCFALEKIDYVSNGEDTYSILPKMKQIRDFCPMKMMPFEYEFKVPNELQRSKVLLHVRTMYGKSVNTVFANE